MSKKEEEEQKVDYKISYKSLVFNILSIIVLFVILIKFFMSNNMLCGTSNHPDSHILYIVVSVLILLNFGAFLNQFNIEWYFTVILILLWLSFMLLFKLLNPKMFEGFIA